MCGSLLSGLAAAASAPFESVPDQSPSSLLPASLAAGSDFHVLDPVRGDGLMHLFVTDSRFGKFAAYGAEEVAKGEEQLRASLPAESRTAGRELWLAGTLSDRARSELQARDWVLHELPQAPSGDTATH
jgi:hypothetical protein